MFRAGVGSRDWAVFADREAIWGGFGVRGEGLFIREKLAVMRNREGWGFLFLPGVPVFVFGKLF